MPFKYLYLFLLIGMFSCHPEIEPLKDHYKYLVLGHIYRFHEWDEMDERIEEIDLEAYDGIWLGGDVCSETTKKESTVAYVDDVFDLGNPNNHWALGNHDYRNGNIEWIEERTGRKTYYSHHHQGITTIVLNTNLDGYDKPENRAPCEEIEAQYDMLMSTLDTIETSSHVFLLMHDVIWGVVPGMPFCYGLGNSCHPRYQFDCEEIIKFYPDVYRKLRELKDKGIEIIVVSGDAGLFKKKFYLKSNHGVHLFMTGISNSLDLCKASEFYHKKTYNFNPDSVLIFHHFPKKRRVEWEYVQLNSLVD